MNFGSILKKFIGKQKLTPVQLAELIGPQLHRPMRKAAENIPELGDILGEGNSERIYFELAAADLSIFTALLFKTCPNRDYAREAYSMCGTFVAVHMSEDTVFKFGYDDLARRFKARGTEYLAVLGASPDGDYMEFAKLYSRNARLADSYLAQQLIWIEHSAHRYEEMLATLWDQVEPVLK
ncbi:MAG TPA: hypothetical protein VN673_15280 [Clostridia bacterium]|nr:hypothetical protein [Clostridia bacterium]